MKPPDDLKRWSKNDLVREVQRLRALTREHAERVGDDPRPAATTGAVVDVAGDPHAEGGALIDMRSAVLLDGTEVVLVDTKRDAVAMVAALRGRVNYSDDRVEHAYLMGADGAAAIVTEIGGLVARAGAGTLDHGHRFAAEFEAAFKRRMEAMP